MKIDFLADRCSSSNSSTNKSICKYEYFLFNKKINFINHLGNQFKYYCFCGNAIYIQFKFRLGILDHPRCTESICCWPNMKIKLYFAIAMNGIQPNKISDRRHDLVTIRCWFVQLKWNIYIFVKLDCLAPVQRCSDDRLGTAAVAACYPSH